MLHSKCFDQSATKKQTHPLFFVIFSQLPFVFFWRPYKYSNKSNGIVYATFCLFLSLALFVGQRMDCSLSGLAGVGQVEQEIRELK